jgi:hypothetical protein
MTEQNTIKDLNNLGSFMLVDAHNIFPTKIKLIYRILSQQ